MVTHTCKVPIILAKAPDPELEISSPGRQVQKLAPDELQSSCDSLCAETTHSEMFGGVQKAPRFAVIAPNGRRKLVENPLYTGPRYPGQGPLSPALALVGQWPRQKLSPSPRISPCLRNRQE